MTIRHSLLPPPPRPPPPPTNPPPAAAASPHPQSVGRATTGGGGGAPDGGWGWVVVTASFVLNCVVDGVCFSFGIFYVELLYEFNESSAKTALVGALLPGMYLIIGPLVGGLTNRFGCRWVTICGSLLASGSIFASSYSVNLDMLMVTYGVLTGIGFGMMYLPSIVIVGFYFERRRALATGIAVCGSGVGTFIFAPFSRLLLDYFGWRGGNQLLAGVILNGVVCGAVFRPLGQTRKEDNSTTVAVEQRNTEVPRRRRYVQRGLIMQKIIDEKKRQRTISTGSLDGTIITKDNQLIRPSELSVHSSINSLKIAGGQAGVLETIPEVVTVVPTTTTTTTTTTEAEVKPIGRSLENETGNCSVRYSKASESASHASERSVQVVEPSGLQVVEPPQGSDELYTSTLTFSTDDDTYETSKGDAAPFARTYNFRPISWLSSASADLPETELVVPDMRTEAPPPPTARPLYRHDTFYSGSVLNLPDVRRNPEITTYASIPVIPQTGNGLTSPCSNMAPAVAVLKTMLDFNLLRSYTFALLCVALVLPFIGFFTPYIYLTAYAMSLDVSVDDATFLLSILGIVSAGSRLLVGFMADHKCIDCVLMHNAALLFAGAMTCLVPILHNYELLVMFAALFGLCIAAFVTLKSILLVELLGLENLTTAFGLIGFFQGICTLLGGPLAGFVLDQTGSYVDSFLMAGFVIALGGLLCLPIRKVARWESRRGGGSSHAAGTADGPAIKAPS